jgi:hypothetical protein
MILKNYESSAAKISRHAAPTWQLSSHAIVNYKRYVGFKIRSFCPLLETQN